MQHQQELCENRIFCSFSELLCSFSFRWVHTTPADESSESISHFQIKKKTFSATNARIGPALRSSFTIQLSSRPLAWRIHVGMVTWQRPHKSHYNPVWYTVYAIISDILYMWGSHCFKSTSLFLNVSQVSIG